MNQPKEFAILSTGHLNQISIHVWKEAIFHGLHKQLSLQDNPLQLIGQLKQHQQLQCQVNLSLFINKNGMTHFRFQANMVIILRIFLQLSIHTVLNSTHLSNGISAHRHWRLAILAETILVVLPLERIYVMVSRNVLASLSTRDLIVIMISSITLEVTRLASKLKNMTLLYGTFTCELRQVT